MTHILNARGHERYDAVSPVFFPPPVQSRPTLNARRAGKKDWRVERRIYDDFWYEFLEGVNVRNVVMSDRRASKPIAAFCLPLNELNSSSTVLHILIKAAAAVLGSTESD